MFVPSKLSHYTPGVQLFIRRVDSPGEEPAPVKPVSRVIRVPAEEDTPDTLVLFYADGSTSAVIEETSIALSGLHEYLVEIPDRFAVVFFERVAGYVWTFTPAGYQGCLPVFDTHEEAQSYAEQVLEDPRGLSSRPLTYPLTYVIHNVSELFQE